MTPRAQKLMTIQAARTPGGFAYVKSKRPVVVAIACNLCIGAVKFIAALLSGSAAMIAEGIHSVVDSANAGILLYGMKRSDRKADCKHPFGYSRELYFWTLIAGIILFALGGGLSIEQGISRLREITPDTGLGDPTLSYIVLGISMVVEGYALVVALKTFNRNREGRPIRQFMRDAKDPSLSAVLIEDLSDELGLVFALAGTLLAHLTGNLYFDAAASVLIGVLLTGMALSLLVQTKTLLIGEGLSAESVGEVRRIVSGMPQVESCDRVLSLFLGPDDLLMTIEVTFDAQCSGQDIAHAIRDAERILAEEFPQATRIFIEPAPNPEAP